MRHRTGQSILEFAVMAVAVVAALVTMFSFIRASVSHMAKTSADTFGQGMLFQ